MMMSVESNHLNKPPLMTLSKLIPFTLIAAAFASTLTLSSCGSDSSSPSSDSSTEPENTLDLITPYEITIAWNDVSEVLNMRPSTEVKGSSNVEVLLGREDIYTMSGIYQWVTFPNDETHQAELVLEHQFLEQSDTSIKSTYTYTIYFTFTDKTTATATIKLKKIIDGAESPEEWIHDKPASFSRPLY